MAALLSSDKVEISINQIPVFKKAVHLSPPPAFFPLSYPDIDCHDKQASSGCVPISRVPQTHGGCPSISK